MTNPRLIKLAQLEGSLYCKQYIENNALHLTCVDGVKCDELGPVIYEIPYEFVNKLKLLANKLNVEFTGELTNELFSEFSSGFTKRQQSVSKYREAKIKAGREWHCKHCP